MKIIFSFWQVLAKRVIKDYSRGKKKNVSILLLVCHLMGALFLSETAHSLNTFAGIHLMKNVLDIPGSKNFWISKHITNFSIGLCSNLSDCVFVQPETHLKINFNSTKNLFSSFVTKCWMCCCSIIVSIGPHYLRASKRKNINYQVGEG